MNDLQASKCGIGILLTIILIKFLKNYFKISRPDKTLKGYGFPSTRGGVLFFIISYLIFNNKLSTKTKLLLFVIGIFLCFLKYYFNEHSIQQLLIGALIGIFISFIISKNYINKLLI